MTTPPASPSELPECDRELLSAYLDNELTLAERATLEQRLVSESALRRELAELRATRDLLREQPWIAPPRSFTLIPEMAGMRQRRFVLRAWLQPLSGLVALAIVMLIGWQVLSLGSNETFDSQPQAMAAPTSLPAAPAAIAPLAEPTSTADQPMAAAAALNERNGQVTAESASVLTVPTTAPGTDLQLPGGAVGNAGPLLEPQRQTAEARPSPPPLPVILGLALLIVLAAIVWWRQRNAE
ncbi:MAG: anti-sigma factor [Chloroflexus sp.]